VADCVATAFTQYQWNYKRFKPRPGSGLPDIYRASRTAGAAA
jgi:lauroyl/myristoyl acyltransferase